MTTYRYAFRNLNHSGPPTYTALIDVEHNIKLADAYYPPVTYAERARAAACLKCDPSEVDLTAVFVIPRAAQ